MGAEAERNQQTETPVTVPTTVPNPNPITETQFVAWKLRKSHISQPFRYIFQDADTSARKDEASRKRAEDIAAGLVQMNGRELFVHEPWVFDDTHY